MGGRHLFLWRFKYGNVKICGKHYTKEQERELEELAVRYRKCLDQSKTERECVTLSIAMAEENGYQNIEDCIREGVTLKAGIRFMHSIRRRRWYFSTSEQNR